MRPERDFYQLSALPRVLLGKDKSPSYYPACCTEREKGKRKAVYKLVHINVSALESLVTYRIL